MKISKSKKELARIISENGGWREECEWSAQQGDGEVWFCTESKKPVWNKGRGTFIMGYEDHFTIGTLIHNRHQCILSRAEYLHLYPAPDADGWIEWGGGECPVERDSMVDYKLLSGSVCVVGEVAGSLIWRHGEVGTASIVAYRLHKTEQSLVELCGEVKEENKHEHVDAKPTIEQLAADYRNAKDYADRKQQEADAAKADADEKLRVLELAGEALGLLVSPITEKQEPELVITDWRDLKVGDEVECLQINITGNDYADERIGTIGLVSATEEPGRSGQAVKLKFNDDEYFWVSGWRFIRRP